MNRRTKLSGRVPFAIAATMALAAPAIAQEAPAAAPAGAADTGPLQEVVVSGVREAIRDSLAVKRDANLISDNITTVDMGQLPDVTIAEELDRLPGVNTTRGGQLADLLDVKAIPEYRLRIG